MMGITQYVDIAVGLLVLALLGWIFHEGEVRIENADAKAAAAQVVHNDEVQNQAALAISAAEARYQTAVASAPIAPVHVRVCNPATNPVPGVTASPSPLAGAASLPAAMGSSRDIGPDSDKLLDEADATIVALQAVILADRAEINSGH